MATSRIVAGRASRDGLVWWAIGPAGPAPTCVVRDAARSVRPSQSAPLGGAPANTQIFLVAASGLAAGSVHELEIAFADGTRATNQSRTLPASLSPDDAFTIAIGSCFGSFEDRGRLNSFYPPPQFRPAGTDPVRLRLLVGDQLYMDLNPIDGSINSFSTPAPAERHAAQWKNDTYGPFIENGPTLFMADDHEFWNNYPARTGVQIPWAIFADKAPFDNAFSNFQAALNLTHADVRKAMATQSMGTMLTDTARTFEVADAPLPIFFLDTRTNRAGGHFTKDTWLRKACAWMANLKGPGILVVSQPLIEKHRFFLVGLFVDKNLPDFKEDFATLWNAIVQAKHDIIIVSGDIHWSRLYQVNNPRNPTQKIFELISSSASRIHFGSDNSGVETTQGAVKWDGGGTVSYTRVDQLAFNAVATFATMTLRSRSADPSTPVFDVAFNFHFPPGSPGNPNEHASSSVFTLR